MVVGKTKQVAADRPGTGQAHRLKGFQRLIDFTQVREDRQLRPRMVGRGDHANLLDALVAPQSETCIGTANISNERRLHFSASRLSVNALAPCSDRKSTRLNSSH